MTKERTSGEAMRSVGAALMAVAAAAGCSNGGDGDPGNPGSSGQLGNPVVEAVAPQPSELITPLVPLTFRVSDDGAIDDASLVVRVNDQDMTAAAKLDGPNLVIAPSPAAPWPRCALAVAIEIKDAQGNKGQGQFEYVVQPCAQPRATPAQGAAPLDVLFYPDTLTSNTIVLVEWDFEGDGVFDLKETIGGPITRRIQVAGSYTPRLRVTDSLGWQGEGTLALTVSNAPPQVRATVSPGSGQVPLQVAFDARATDYDGIALYEWDFDGDGVFDYSSDRSPRTSYTYSSTGQYQARLRVTDRQGQNTEVSVPSTQVRASPEGWPSMQLFAGPESGDVPLTVRFNARDVDPQRHRSETWSWDWDGDGNVDEQGGADAAHTFTAPGTFFPRVRVEYDDARFAEAAVEVRVQPVVSLSIATDTIDTGLGEAAEISSDLGGRLPVSIVIESRGGRPVKTLLPFTERDRGVHKDTWDGTDESGNVVVEGDYYAVLLYRLGDELIRYDLRTETGGTIFYPDPGTIPTKFRPFAAAPLRVDYTLERAAEVSAFMGYINNDERARTFFLRRPQGRGSHTILWNGVNDAGQLRHPSVGGDFTLGLYAYTLPDNTIFVRSGPHVVRANVEPLIYYPDARWDGDKRPGSTIEFELSAAGSADIVISNSETGGTVRHQRLPNLPPGVHRFTWDGRSDEGVYVATGAYRIGVTAFDDRGHRSLAVYALQRVRY